MAFSSLTSNQMVSEADAATAGFTLNSGQSHGSSNQCMTKSDALTKYNIDASAMSSYANNQLVPKSTWAIREFSATMTVGRDSVYYGYYISLFGSITNNDISSIAGSGSLIRGLYYHNQTGNIIFVITNGSSTIPPDGWTTLSINGTAYNRSSFTNNGYVSYGGYWQWVLRTSNTIGTTVGATRTITLT